MPNVPYARLIVAVLLIGVILPGCVQWAYRSADQAAGQDTPKKIGNPYTVAGKTYYPVASAERYDETGIASWYGPDFHGRRTANGERYDMHAMTAAHTILPLPTLARVTNLENGRQVVVRINDRGPFVKNRLIDLSYAAAKALGYEDKGTARVRVQALSDREPSPQSNPAPEAMPVGSRPPQKAAMYVQVGAFASRENAYRLSGNLSSEFPNTHVSTLAQQTKQLYRVRIGPFSDVRQIEQTVIQLQRHGQTETVVMME